MNRQQELMSEYTTRENERYVSMVAFLLGEAAKYENGDERRHMLIEAAALVANYNEETRATNERLLAVMWK